MSVELIDIVRFAILVIFTEAVTEILVAAKITDGLRRFIFNRAFPSPLADSPSPPVGNVFWRTLNDLFMCGYCLSVWVAMFSALFAPGWFGWWCINWLIMVFVLHRISNFLHVVFSIIKMGRVKTHDIIILHKHQVEDGSIGSTGSQEIIAP